MAAFWPSNAVFCLTTAAAPAAAPAAVATAVESPIELSRLQLKRGLFSYFFTQIYIAICVDYVNLYSNFSNFSNWTIHRNL